jgi:hypothetical protein
MPAPEQSETPQPAQISWCRFMVKATRVIVAVILVLFVLGLVFPVKSGHARSNRSIAKSQASELVTAIKTYESEYGKLPPFEGTPESQSAQAQLIRILQGISYNPWNPRRVCFWDALPAIERGSWGARKYGAGIHPKSGVYLDPWGRPFRILLDSDYDYKITTPYTDIAEVHGRAAIWSLGKDGIQGSRGKENILKGSDDIVSW